MALDTDTYQQPAPLDTYVGPGTDNVQPTDFTAQVRASNASFGLGQLLPSREDLIQRFSNGQENSVREQASSQLNFLKQSTAMNKVAQISGSPAWGVPELRPVLKAAVDKTIQDGAVQTDPASVFEETYGHKMVTALDDHAPALPSVTNQARSELDIEADKAIGLGQDYYAKRAYAFKRYQDMADLSAHSSWTSYLTDKFLTSFQIYNEVRQRGNTDGYFEGGLLAGLGSQQEAQYQDLLQLPFDQYKVKLDAIVNRLQSNPDSASSFLEGLVDPSTSRTFVNNAFSVLAPLDIAGASKLGFGLVRGAVLKNSLNRAIKTQIGAVEAASALKTPESVAAAASGDLSTATVLQAAKDTQELIQGVEHAPTRQALDSLVSGLRDQISQAEKDPGNYGQEGVNRLKEHTVAFIQNVVNGVNRIVQVERIPGFLASQEAVARYYKSIQDLYPGFTNSITDLGSPIRIEWDQPTNTYHIPIYFGDGPKAFSSPQTAYNKAVQEGLIPASVTRLQEINETFGNRSNVLFKKINDLKAELRKTGPAAAEVDFEGIRNEITKTEKELDDLMTWHADQLAGDSGPEPLNKQIVKTNRGGFEIVEKPGAKTAAGRSVEEIQKDINQVKNQFVEADATGTYFTPEDLANNAQRLEALEKELAGFTVRQQGNGYYIKIVKPVDETHQLIRDSILNPKATTRWNNLTVEENTTPHGFFKDWFGWARTPDEVLSSMHTANRKVAAYAPSVFQQILKENAKYLDDLYSGVIREDAVTGEKIGFIRARANALMNGTYWSPTRSKLYQGTRWNRFVRFLDHGIKLMDDQLDSNGQPLQGYFFKTPGEFERRYTSLFGRAPDPLETAAYFAFRRQYEADKMFREMQMYKNAVRLGTEEHSISFFNDQKEKIQSPYFAGIKLDHMPGGDDNVLVMRSNGQSWMGQANQYIAAHKSFNDLVRQGRFKVTRIFAADERPLKGFNGIKDEKIHYVVTETAPETRPLQLGNMLPRRGGGHVIYDYDHYIKQASVKDDGFGNFVYEGDKTVMPISNRALGRRVANHLDQVRQYLKDGDEANAERYTRANLPIEFKEVKSWFDQKHLNLDEPFQVVPKNRNIGDMNNSLAQRWAGKKFKDATKGGSPAELLRTRFSDARDADLMYTINDYGKQSRPLYKYEPAGLVDPMITLNRSLKQITESNFMDDYKLYAVEHWLQEHWNKLDTPGDKPYEEIMKSPFYYFYNGQYKSGLSLADKSEAALRRFQIRQFLGTPSKVSELLDNWSQSLADKVYEDKFFARTLLGNRLSMAPSWLLHQLPNAAQKLRTATYHATIGLFSWPQILAQNMNYVTMSGLAGPTRGAQGGVAALLHQYARLLGPTTDMLDRLDQVAVNMGLFKPGEFKEAFDLLKNTGFDVVGGEHASLERIYTPRVVSSGMNKFLDFGDIFFKGGERHARFGAWYIAYKEQRQLKPYGRLTNKDLVQILDRSDYLAGNMSRASKSILQNGIGQFPFQFLGYSMRVAEQFTGTRIGWKARLGLLGAFGLAFGAPQAASLSGIPLDKYIRQYEMYNGYQTGASFWKDILNNGIPAMMFAAASGAGDWQKGTQPNFGQRYGSPGLDIIRDTLSGDKTIRKLLAGASGSFLGNLIDNTAGFRRAMYATINGDTDHFKLLPSDFTDPFSAVSSVAYTKRWWNAVNQGKWLSRNGTNLAQGAKQDITPAMATLLTATGTQPQQVADATLMSANHAWDMEQQKQAEKDFIREWNRGEDSLLNDDPDTADSYFKRAQQILVDADYPMNLRNQLFDKTARNFPKSLLDKLDEVYLQNHPPPSQMEIRRNILSREHELYDIKRGQ